MVRGFEKSTASRGIDIIGESNVSTTLALGQRINKVQTGIPTSVHHNGARNVTSSCHFYRKRMLHIPARPNRSGLARTCDSLWATTYDISFENEGQDLRRQQRCQNGASFPSWNPPQSRTLLSVFLQKYAIFNPMIAYIAIYTSR